MAGFWSGILGGKDENLNTNIGNFNAVGGATTKLGLGNVTQASKFFSDIVSGDATKQMQALAPEVSAAKKSTQQDTKTATEMGTRSGGTAASNASAKDRVHSYITSLIGSLTGTAASGLASTGSSLIDQGMQAYSSSTELSEERLQNWSDSILGLGVTKGAGFAEGFGLSKIPGAQSSSST